MYEDTPDDIVHDLLAKAAYGEHSLGYPILGTDKHLNSFTREDLFAYKDTFYNPSNVVISVAGYVDTEFITKVEDYFNQFENESKPNKIEKQDRKSTRFNSSHVAIQYAVFCFAKY